MSLLAKFPGGEEGYIFTAWFPLYNCIDPGLHPAGAQLGHTALCGLCTEQLGEQYSTAKQDLVSTFQPVQAAVTYKYGHFMNIS